jgi:hypothetical protein
MTEIITYNEKALLLPDSTRNAAIYHALVEPSGIYRFRIHDYRSAVRLHGDLTDPEQVREAVQKLRRLAKGALDFANFIDHNYNNLEYEN